MDGSRLLRTRWLPVAVYVALIFSLSAQAGLTVPGTFEWRDKIAHTLEYGVLGFLVFRAARDTWPNAPVLRRMILAALAVATLGAIDEYFQAFVPGRDSTVYDWYADATGATLSQIICWALAKRREGA
jgi:VanZ family protein